MQLKKATIQELRQILKEEFNFNLEGKQLDKFAHNLVGYFDLLMKINSRSEVRK